MKHGPMDGRGNRRAPTKEVQTPSFMMRCRKPPEATVQVVRMDADVANARCLLETIKQLVRMTPMTVTQLMRKLGHVDTKRIRRAIDDHPESFDFDFCKSRRRFYLKVVDHGKN